MSTYVLDRDQRQRAIVSFEELWEHYLATGYIYPEKAQRLEPYMPEIQRTWPRLMRGPDTLFQLYTGRSGDRIGATHSVFRDTVSGMTMQHASSDGDPAGLLACMRAELAAYPSTGCGFLGTYYRPENRWTSRICEVVSQVHPAEHQDTLTRQYLTWRPASGRTSTPRLPVRVLSSAEAGAARQLAMADQGELRSEALDLVQGRDPSTPEMTELYAKADAERYRQVWVADRDGRLAGLAIRYWGSPINSGLICQRAEILVDPALDARAAAGVVFDLSATLQGQASPTDHLIPLLIADHLADAAIEAGFEGTGRRYSHALWRMSCGTSYGIQAIDAYYERVKRQADRLRTRMAQVG